MKFLFVLVICAAFSTVVVAQQTTVINDPNAKTRSLDASFSSISVTDGIELYLTRGEQESIAISASEEKYEERFITVIEDGVLKIYFDNNGINWSDNNRRKLKAYVSFKTLKRLLAAGGADVKATALTDVDDLFMKFTSGAAFTGNLKGKDIMIEQNSGSVINMSGSAEKLSIDLSSGAVFKGYEFTSDYCSAKVSSGANVQVSIEKELSAHVNSGGKIHYKGTNAVIKDIDIRSGGIVKKA